MLRSRSKTYILALKIKIAPLARQKPLKTLRLLYWQK